MEFRDVVGFEDYYEISNTGVLRAKSRSVKCCYGSTQVRSAMELKFSINAKGGYLQCHLSRNKVRYTKYQHRLMAEAFIPNPDNLAHVNHKDGNKLNNNLSNLEWCSLQDNMKHARETGLSRSARGRYSGKSKLTESDVIEIRMRHSNGEQLKTLSLEFGVNSSSTLCAVVSRKTWTHI